MLFQMHGLFYHMRMDASQWVIVALMIYPLYMLNQHALHLLFKKSSTRRPIIAAALLSIMAYIVLLFSYLNTFQMIYLRAVVGYLSLLFMMIYALLHALEKVSWSQRKQPHQVWRFGLYMLLPMTLYGFLLTACYPGLISPDGLYIWNQVANHGPYDNLHPILYTLFLRGLYVLGFRIWGVMILQALLCAAAYGYIAYRLDRMGLPLFWCIAMIILLTIYPLNFMNAITFWKDIPYTIGLSILTLELLRMVMDRHYFKSIINHILLGIALLLIIVSRHNGILIAVLSLTGGGLIYGLQRQWFRFKPISIYLCTALFIYLAIPPAAMALLGERYQEPENNDVTQTAFFATRVQGLVVLYHDQWDTLSPEDQVFINRFLNLDALDAHLEKYEKDNKWQYYSRTKAYADAPVLLNNKQDFNTGYFRLLKKYPYPLVNAYLKLTGLVWSAPEYGYTAHASYPYNFYDTDQYDNVEISQHTYNRKLKDYILTDIYLEDASASWHAVWWRPALFLLLSIFFLVGAIRRHGKEAILLGIPVLVNSLGYLIVIEAQDARYTYINLTACVILAAYALMKAPEDTPVESEI